MEQAKISTSQLFALMMLFDLGTALVVQIGFSAGRGVWLSILLAAMGGIPLYFMFDYLYRQYPNLPLSGYVRQILGRYVGSVVCLLYFGFFILHGSRVLRETSELMVTSIYDQTPLFVVRTLISRIFSSGQRSFYFIIEHQDHIGECHENPVREFPIGNCDIHPYSRVFPDVWM